MSVKPETVMKKEKKGHRNVTKQNFSIENFAERIYFFFHKSWLFSDSLSLSAHRRNAVKLSLERKSKTCLINGIKLWEFIEF